MTKQAELINKYFSFVGVSLDRITAIENDKEIVFIITFTNSTLVSVKPIFKIDEIISFVNNVRIIFKK
jgi:hypothetical protein